MYNKLPQYKMWQPTWELSLQEVVDQAITAQYLDQHAGDADAEVLHGFEEIAYQSPFYQGAEYLIGKNYQQQDRDGDALEVVCGKGGTAS